MASGRVCAVGLCAGLPDLFWHRDCVYSRCVRRPVGANEHDLQVLLSDMADLGRAGGLCGVVARISENRERAPAGSTENRCKTRPTARFLVLGSWFWRGVRRSVLFVTG